MRSQSPQSTGRGFYLAATASLILAALVGLVLLSNKPGPRRPPEISGVETVAGDLRTVPDVTPEQHRVVQLVVSEVLQHLYERAFIRSIRRTISTPSSPGPTAAIDEFFTPEARAALDADPAVFTIPTRVDVRRGRLSYEGLVTVDGGRGVEAFLNVLFEAYGVDRKSPMRVTQQGTVLLLHTPDGWRVSGFDLHFASDPLTSPTPSP